LGVNLAKEEVSQARDRFQAGVANNIEIISAQDAWRAPTTTRSELFTGITRLVPNLAHAIARLRSSTRNEVGKNGT